MNVKKFIKLFALLFMIGLFTGCSNVTGNKMIKSEKPNLIVQSNVLMTENNINSQIGGKIENVQISEGDTVKKGQVLATINSDLLIAKKAQIQAQIETINAQINSAQAGKNAANAQLQEAKNGARIEEINQAKSAYDLTKETYDRTKSLYDDGASSKANLDNVESQLQIAKNKYDLLVNGTRPETIARIQAQVDQSSASIQGAQGQLKQAQAALQEIMVNINNTTITAPADGVITQLNVKTGDLVSSGMPILVITNVESPSIMCNIKESDLSKVDLNQKVSINFPAYKNKKFTGKVVRINKNADFAVKRATNDNGEFDILSYGVKVEIDNLKVPLRAGMTAFVDFGK